MAIMSQRNPEPDPITSPRRFRQQQVRRQRQRRFRAAQSGAAKAQVSRSSRNQIRQPDQAAIQNARDEARQKALEQAEQQGLAAGPEDIQVERTDEGRFRARVKDEVLREDARQDALQQAQSQGLEGITESDIRVERTDEGRVQARVEEDALRGALTSQVVEEANVGPGQVQIEETDEGLQARVNPELLEARARSEAAQEAGVPVEAVEVERGAFAEPSRRNRPVLGGGDRSPTTVRPDDGEELRAFVDPEALRAQREQQASETERKQAGRFDAIFRNAAAGAPFALPAGTSQVPGTDLGTEELEAGIAGAGEVDIPGEPTKTGVGKAIRQTEITGVVPGTAGLTELGTVEEQEAGFERARTDAVKSLEASDVPGTQAAAGLTRFVVPNPAGAVSTTSRLAETAAVTIPGAVAAPERAARGFGEVAQTSAGLAAASPELAGRAEAFAREKPVQTTAGVAGAVAGGLAGGKLLEAGGRVARSAARQADPRVGRIEGFRVSPGQSRVGPGQVTEFETSTAPRATPRAVEEVRTKAEDVPETVDELIGGEGDTLVGIRGDPAGGVGAFRGRSVEIGPGRARTEFAGAFGTPISDLSGLRLAGDGNFRDVLAGTPERIREGARDLAEGPRRSIPRRAAGKVTSDPLFPRLPTTKPPDAVTAFELKDIRALPARAKKGTSEARQFLFEEAERGVGFVRRADRRTEEEFIVPPGTRLRREGKFDIEFTGDEPIRGKAGRVPGVAFRLADEQPAPGAGGLTDDIADAADEGDDFVTAEELARSRRRSLQREQRPPITPTPLSPTSGASDASASSLAAAPSAAAVTNVTSASEAGVRGSRTTLQGVSERTGATTTETSLSEPTETLSEVTSAAESATTSEATTSASESVSEPTSTVSEASFSEASEVSEAASESLSEATFSLSEGAGSSGVSQGGSVTEGGPTLTPPTTPPITPPFTPPGTTVPPFSPDPDEGDDDSETDFDFDEAQFEVDLGTTLEVLTGDIDIERGPVDAAEEADVRAVLPKGAGAPEEIGEFTPEFGDEDLLPDTDDVEGIL